jgi:regulatory protein
LARDEQSILLLHLLWFLTFLYFFFLSLYAPSMRSSPRKLCTETDLYTAAINSLARRAYSVYEMRSYLERRAQDKEVVKGVLDRLKQLEYLDDARYARQFVRLHTELRKQGPFRIARDLRARGVPDRHIEAALAERSADSSESAIVRERLERRIKLLHGPLDERRVASLYRSLLRAGFSADTIRHELSALTKKPMVELPESPAEEA